jgi:hypothetical protein
MNPVMSQVIFPEIVQIILDFTNSFVIGGGVMNAIDPKNHTLHDLDVFIPAADIKAVCDILLEDLTGVVICGKDKKVIFEISKGKDIREIGLLLYGENSYKIATLIAENISVDIVVFTTGFKIDTCIDFEARKLRFDGEKIIGPIEDVQNKVLRYNKKYFPLVNCLEQVESLIETGTFCDKTLTDTENASMEILMNTRQKYLSRGWSVIY